MKTIAALVVACFCALVGMGAPAKAQSLIYWQCALPVAGQINGGQCPVSSSNPLPISGTISTTSAPTNAAGAYSAATIGTSDSTILAASTAKVFLDLVNNSATATVCINFGAVATIAGSVCGAGEVTLPPLYHRSWEGTFVPSDAIHAIASASSTPASVGAK